jgi:hypothetical protein
LSQCVYPISNISTHGMLQKSYFRLSFHHFIYHGEVTGLTYVSTIQDPINMSNFILFHWSLDQPTHGWNKRFKIFKCMTNKLLPHGVKDWLHATCASTFYTSVGELIDRQIKWIYINVMIIRIQQIKNVMVTCWR